jgi:hypothetical protein
VVGSSGIIFQGFNYKKLLKKNPLQGYNKRHAFPIVTKSHWSKCELKLVIGPKSKGLGCESANKKANMMNKP